MVAMLVGMDPDMYLSAPAWKRPVLNEVARQAQEDYVKRKDAEIRAIGIAVSNAIAQLFRK